MTRRASLRSSPEWPPATAASRSPSVPRQRHPRRRGSGRGRGARQAIDADGGTDAMNNLANLLAHRGATQEAERLYRLADTGGSSRARNNLTHLINPPMPSR